MSNFYPKEFKEAISNLPSKEKDKLIFRLLKKDLVLANRLMFELVSADSVDQRRDKVKKQIQIKINNAYERFYSVGYLNMDVREISGMISEHVSTTKDKFGEAHLNLWMLNQILEQNKPRILSVTPGKARKFCVAVIARAFKIMMLVNKLHHDYFIEFQDDLVLLGNLIAETPYLMNAAINNGLDINWLTSAQIPENITEIHKNIRANGFLK